MKTRKCDRCYKYYDIYNVRNDSKNTNSFKFLNTDSNDHYFLHKTIDLCPKCNDELHKWLESYIKGE